MATADDIPTATDSTTGWVAEHVRNYVASGGTEGHIWNGVPTLVLVTSGRSSGTPRRTALIYGEFDGEYAIVASKGGAPTDPQWYLNLQSDPRAGVMVATRTFTATSRVAGPEEYPRIWAGMAEIFPTYEDYAKKTDRQIPIVMLRPVA